ncbi:hypothetical protein VNO78_30556 [Psophocarpus tetragonolobus]|uniref:Uncharacterized protein n=1 Tax=Psophocarpus tetragonolobus TaxID=3891 RepID=A0AAN9X507_PSOTE
MQPSIIVQPDKPSHRSNHACKEKFETKHRREHLYTAPTHDDLMPHLLVTTKPNEKNIVTRDHEPHLENSSLKSRAPKFSKNYVIRKKKEKKKKNNDLIRNSHSYSHRLECHALRRRFGNLRSSVRGGFEQWPGLDSGDCGCYRGEQQRGGSAKNGPEQEPYRSARSWQEKACLEDPSPLKKIVQRTLQQFRQKKDSKSGSSRGKSSKKAGIPQLLEDDSDASSAVSSQITDGNVEDDSHSNMVNAESPESQSVANSLTPDNIDSSVDSSSVVCTYDKGNETVMDSNAEVGHQVHEVRENDSELSAPDQGEIAQDIGANVPEDVPLRISDTLVPEGGETHVHASVPVAILSPPVSVTTAACESITDERDGEKREELLLLTEDIPNTSVMQTREDQEADGFDMKKSYQSTDAMIGGQKEHPLSEVGESDQSISGIALEKTRIEEASHEAEQLGKSIELLSSNEEIVSDKLSGAHEFDPARPLNVTSVFDVSSINLLQLAEIIRGLNEEECQFLIEARAAVSDLDPLTSSSVLSDHDISEAFHSLKEELFLANLMKNIVDTQLAEQLESDDHHHQLVDEISQLHASHNKVNEKNLHLTEELANCRVELHDISSKNVELQNQFNAAMSEVEALSTRVVELQNSFDLSQNDSLELSTELSDCRGLLSSLQVEKKGMNEALDLMIAEKNELVEKESKNLADQIKNLEDKNQLLVLENQRLSSQIIALNEQLSAETRNLMRFEGDLKEATMCLEQFSRENEFLNNTLDKHKAKIDVGKEHSQPLSQPTDLQSQVQVACEQSKGPAIAITEDSLLMDREPHEGESGGPHGNILEREVFDDSHGFVSLKACVDEVEEVLVKLEKAINQLHCQSISSSRAGEKPSSPVVSKLIQAFESKVQEDEHEAEIRGSGIVQSSSNSFILLTTEQIGNLKKLLSKWKLDVQIAGALFKGERVDRKSVDTRYSDLKYQFEQLKQHCSDLEASNIELAVQYETAKQLLGDIQEKKCLLEELYDALKQEDTCLKAKNNELYEKLGYCQSKISALQTEMNDVKQISNDMASTVGSQLENLQKEVTERTMLLEQGWNMTIAQILELVGKLKESVGGTLCGTVSSDAHSNLDISHQLEVSVNAAAEMIFDLQKKLEASCSEHEIICKSYHEMNSKCDDLLGRNELAAGLLHNMYTDLRKLVLSNGGTMDEDKVDLQTEPLPDLLSYNSYQPILEHIGKILIKKLELEDLTKEMKSELMHRETEMEELKMKCLGLDSVGKLIEDVAGMLNTDISMIDINKSPLSCLNSLVSSLVQKTRETEIQYHTTKERCGSKEMELAELKEKMHYLDTLRLENVNEILVLKESLHQAEEALTVAYSELHKKANELEHSEQRVSSIREKLSIAVAKGKGLVVQRDGLKQSLAETSSELEKCLQELQLKDTRLHEVETKLKTYAEAGERVEAMESELSYIRNSSNALRESFLLKDSMLQRIEEILEDLDLPEQFHSRDIIEKIDWLASSVSGNSLPMNVWDQRDAAGGGSYSDASYAVTDSWKDDSQQQPDSDDFRKKFEELQSKYYGVAEQNEMLEQSLMERNSLVQRWEELVNRVEMPSNLQSMETEDKIECIGTALMEANHHIDSLQLKIEKYDSFCELLNASLEESQRTLSALQEDLSALTSERDHLSEKMESMVYENEKLSLQTRETELENEKLQGEITSLKDELEHKAAIEEHILTIDDKIRKLKNLVGDALPESETENMVSGSSNIDSLEELLEKLVEKLNMERKLSSQTREAVLENGKLHSEISSLKDKLEQKAAIEEHILTIDDKIRKLTDLIGDALPESETENMVSGSSNIDSLAELLEKLVEKLNMERKLSAQIREAELENEKLHSEISSLEDKLEQKAAIEEQIFTIDGKIRKLQDLVGGALSEKESLVSDSANIDSLEELLRKLVENPVNLLSMKPAHEVVGDGLHSQEDDVTLNEERDIDVHDKEVEDIDRYKRDLEESLDELMLVKEQRDRALEKEISLSGEVEALTKIIAELQVLHIQEEQKSGSVKEKLSGEVEALTQRIEELQGLLNQEAAHIDRYKRDLEESLNELMHVKEERDRSLEKQISLSGEVEVMTKRIDELQGLLDLEEQKSASVKEKLSGEVESLTKRIEELQGLLNQEVAHIDRYKRDLEESLNESVHLKEERDRSFEKQISLSGEVEVMTKRIEELQGLLDLEEQKSAFVKEKLSREVEALTKRIEELQGLLNQEAAHIDRYKRDLEESLNESMHLKEERGRSFEKQISLSGEVEVMTKRIEELQGLLHLEEQKSASVKEKLSGEVETLTKRIEQLQGLLSQEEQKSASVREKLNVAVRKGKSLVQQRDSLKQTIEEMTVEMENLKSEINNRENTLAEHEQKLRQLSTYPDRLEALESESLLLKKHLEETEFHFQDQEYSLKLILNKLGEIEVGDEGHISDPVKKLEWVGKLCSDLHSSVTSLEQESRKSKRASELLLAELNEVQERNDSFQEELAKVTAELMDLRRERDTAEAAKLEALGHLEKLSALNEEGKKSHFSDIMELKSSMNQVCKSFCEIQNLLCDAFFLDLESYRKLEAGLESCMKGNNDTNVVDSSFTKEYDGILHWSSANKKSSPTADTWSDFDTIDHYDDNSIVEISRLSGHQLRELMVEVSSLKEKVNMHSRLAQEQDKNLSELMARFQREMTYQTELCETMKKGVSERDEKLVALCRNIACLYEACMNSVIVLENGKTELVGKKVESSDLGIKLETPSDGGGGISEECIKTMTDRLMLAANGFASIKTEFLDADLKEMKATITNLQRELQEKDVQRDQICSELVKQIKDAEAAANSYSQDLQAFRIQEHNLKKEVEVIEAERKMLEQRVNELQDRQDIAVELEEKMTSQTGLLAAKDQEIEALMHALDEEEAQMEELTNRIVDLEKVVQQKNEEIENLEASRGRVMKKLSITVSKFDELHHLSANLLSEVEKLQSQLQERDTEISFLRQEVTRSTNDVLLASQMSNQRSSDEIFEFLMWVDSIVSHDGVHGIHGDMKSHSQVQECKEILHKKLMSLLSELENLREVAESKEALLQEERNKVEELSHKIEILETSLHAKELQLNLLEGVEETGKGPGTSSEIVEVEPVMNEWSTSGAFVTPQVRSLRKGNSDHIAIAVDEDPASTTRIEDEEDDKVHGFKSLTTSKIVPRFTRPLTDLIDGLWVSCDRTLMRQPILRLGIIIYWAIMHALLAFFVV